MTDRHNDITYPTSFTFCTPTAIEYGTGRLAQLPAFVQRLGGRRVLVVGGPGVKAAGIVDRVLDTLRLADIEARLHRRRKRSA